MISVDNPLFIAQAKPIFMLRAAVDIELMNYLTQHLLLWNDYGHQCTSMCVFMTLCLRDIKIFRQSNINRGRKCISPYQTVADLNLQECWISKLEN